MVIFSRSKGFLSRMYIVMVCTWRWAGPDCYLNEWAQRLPTRIFNTRIPFFYFSGDEITKFVFMWQAKIRIDVQWVPPPLGMNANIGGPLYVWSLSNASYWILYTVFRLSDWHLKRTTLTAKLSRGCFSHFYNSVIVWNTQTHTHTHLFVQVGEDWGAKGGGSIASEKQMSLLSCLFTETHK